MNNPQCHLNRSLTVNQKHAQCPARCGKRESMEDERFVLCLPAAMFFYLLGMLYGAWKEPAVPERLLRSPLLQLRNGAQSMILKIPKTRESKTRQLQ